MYKIFLYFLIVMSTFAMDKVNLNQLETTSTNGTTYATMKSLNKIGANIKKSENGYILSTDIGDFTLEGNMISTSEKKFKILSLPYEKNNQMFLPLKIVLNLNGYHLENNVITKSNEIDTPSELPKKIISLSPGISEKIYALGGEKLLIGRTQYCKYPVEIQKIDVVGSMLSPNLEVIVSKNPDLVLAETHFKESIMKKIESFDITVLKISTPKNINEIYESISSIGISIGHPLEARGLNASLKDKVAFTQTLLKGKTPPTVYYIVGTGKSEFTPGKDTFIDSLITLAGGNNVAQDNIGWKYSLESLILKDPKIIFGSKENIQTMINGENYQSLSSIKNKNYAVIPVSVLQLPGPRALTQGVYEMLEVFHPELAKEYKEKVL